MLHQLKVASALILMIIITKAASEDCPEDDSMSHSAETKLRKKLLCNYDTSSRPVKNHNTTVQVTMDLLIKHIQTNDEMQNGDTVNVLTWVALEWKDEYLVWNGSDHSDITTIRIYSDRIWIPEIIIYNSYNPFASAREFSADCMVYQSGYVNCITHANHEATCEVDFTRWPYDTQNCSLVFRTMMYRGETINLTVGITEEEYVLHAYRPNRLWNLESFNVSRDAGGAGNYTFPSITYNLVLKRHSGTHAALITAPAVVMIALTFTSMILKVSTSERVYLLAVNLLCHFLYLENLSWYVPSHGDKCPLVVIFYRDSLIITTVVLIITAILKMLIGRNTSVPNWVDTLITISNSTPGRCVMYASDNADDLDFIVNESTTDAAVKVEQRNIQDWKSFVKIINRLMLLVTVITYMGLFIAIILY